MPLLTAIVTHVFSSECCASVCVRVCSSLFFSRGVAYEGVYTNELGGEGSSSGGGCGGDGGGGSSGGSRSSCV